MRDLIKETEIIIDKVITAVKPDVLIKRKLTLKDSYLQISQKDISLDKYKNIFVIGAGKASAVMAQSIEKIIGDRIKDGVISTKYGHGVPCENIRIFEAGHPIVDHNSIEATNEILKLLENTRIDELVLCLMSGGGSALLESLPAEIGLNDLQIVFDYLLKSGANIEEINVVRKHLSRVKGGQLARAIVPADCVSLILSDVIGDPLESIASGPITADPSTFSDAWNIIEKYYLNEKIPLSVQKYLKKGLDGKVPDTIKANDPILNKISNFIIGNNAEALKVAEKTAKEFGYNTMVLTSRLQGEAKEVAKVVASITQEIHSSNSPIERPACVIMGGETTVTIRGKGKGGRNQELVLAALIAMKSSLEPYIIVSFGTDGSDGPTDAAGGMAFNDIWRQIKSKKLNPQKYLERNDSYHFLEKTGGLIKTGPSGTNVMDIIFILIPE
jgi:glycerate-2-kinase